MFPQKSNGTTGTPGDLWFWWKAPDDKMVWLYQTSWPSVVRSIQRTIIDVFADIKPTDLTQDCAPFGNELINNSPLQITGKMDDNTLSWVALFLCATGNRTAALVASKILTTTSNDITPELLRYLLWIALFVAPGQVNLKATGPRVAQSSRDNGGGIFVDPNTILPSRNINPDWVSDWWANSMAYTRVPYPPPGTGDFAWPAGVKIPAALADGAQPAPANVSSTPGSSSGSSGTSGQSGSGQGSPKSSGGGLGLLALLGAAAYFFWPEKK